MIVWKIISYLSTLWFKRGGLIFNYGDNMSLPPKIEKLINKIEEADDRWKALYMATWDLKGHLDDFRKKQPEFWEKKVGFGLPACRKGLKKYIPKRLQEISMSRDGEITVNHLQTLFSLLEKLCKEIYYHECNKNIMFRNREEIIEFLSERKFLLIDEQNKFRLAGQTRNCVIHNDGEVDSKWNEDFEKLNDKKSPHKEGDDLRYIVKIPDIEEYNDFFLKIVERIKIRLEDDSVHTPLNTNTLPKK